MPAAKLRPVGPSTTTRPPVMYSQPWSPTPSTTANAPGVAHREALAGEPAEEGPAAGGAVEDRVADDHVVLRDVGGLLRRSHGEDAPGQALARVVVGDAVEREGHPRGEPSAEALAGGADEADPDGVLVETGGAARPGDRPGEQPADAAVGVEHRAVDLHLAPVLDDLGGTLDQLPVECVAQHLLGAAHAAARLTGGQRRHGEEPAEVEAPRLPVVDGPRRLEQVDAADELLDERSPRPARMPRTSSATK